MKDSGLRLTLRTYSKCTQTVDFIHIFIHMYTHAELWCTYIQTVAQTLKAQDVFTHALPAAPAFHGRFSYLKRISVWAGRSPDECIMFRDEEKTWQGAVLKSRCPFLSLFLPSWSFKADGIFSSACLQPPRCIFTLTQSTFLRLILNQPLQCAGVFSVSAHSDMSWMTGRSYASFMAVTRINGYWAPPQTTPILPSQTGWFYETGNLIVELLLYIECIIDFPLWWSEWPSPFCQE